MNPVIFFLLIATVFAFIIVAMSIRIIRPFERGLVERLGKYQRILEPGLNMIIPFFDTTIKVDMREVVLDVPPQLVITKDNVNVESPCRCGGAARREAPLQERVELAG
ncbi:MAG: SPFH domain-containing protein, partial [Candidatus Zixiibacteriota bacterium]